MSSSGSITDGVNTYVFSGSSFDLLKALGVNINSNTTSTYTSGEYNQLINLFQNNGAFAGNNATGTSQVASSLASLTSKIAMLTRQINNKIDKVNNDEATGKIIFDKVPRTKAVNAEISENDSNLITKHFADENYSGVPAKFKGEWESHCRQYCKGDVVYYRGSSYVSLKNDNDKDISEECWWHLFAKKGTSITFKGEWLFDEEYNVNDIVTLNGSSYISLIKCNKKSIDDTNVWGLMAQGGNRIQWLGEWEADIHYSYFDVVYYEGSSYLSLKNQNMDPVTFPESWGMVAKAARGLVFRGVYSGIKTYNIDDVVSYKNAIYRSLTGVTQILDRPDVISPDWELMIAAPKDGKSFNFRGEYVPNTNYIIDDVVTMAGSTYINTMATNSTNPLLLVGWSVIAKSGKTFTFRGLWNSQTTYFTNDLVTYEGSTYIALKTNSSAERVTDFLAYKVIAQAGSSLNFRGAYYDQNIYSKFDIVEYNGSSYVYTSLTDGSSLPTTEMWQILAAQSEINFGGNYVSGTYSLGAVVYHNGSSYISLQDNNEDVPTENSVKWSLLAKAGASIVFEGDWKCENTYNVNHVVYYKGGSYVSKLDSNSALPTDDDNWQIIAHSGDINYAGEWQPETCYASGKVVTYCGSSYLSLRDDNEDEPNESCKWALLAKKGDSIQYEGEWDHCAEYKKGDIVSYRGSSYISLKRCNEGYIYDILSWSLLAKKGDFMQYKGKWIHCQEYEKNDVVSYHGSSYISKRNGNTDEPGDSCEWGLVAAGSLLNYKGDYDDSEFYEIGDIVVYEGSSYVALHCGNTALPTDSEEWGLVAVKGTQGTPGINGSPGAASTVPGPPGTNGTNGINGQDGSIDWEGTWDSETRYSEGAVVYYHGSSYISLNNQNTALPTDSCEWNLLAKSGTTPEYEGNYDSSRIYGLDEIVRYKGRSYISLSCDNEDNLPTDSEHWGLLTIDGPKFVGVYENCETYDQNDVVRYHGAAYVSKENSNTSIPTDCDYWMLLLEKGGMNHEGTYDSCHSYAKDDVVEYKGSSYISLVSDNDDLPTDDSKWGIIAKKGTGLKSEGDYNCSEEYCVNDFVYYKGSSYVSKSNNNTALPTDTCMWQILAKTGEMKFKDEWDHCHDYDICDVVYYLGSSYISKKNSNGDLPTNVSSWDLLVEKGDSIAPQGNWSHSDKYQVNDLVFYDGSSYVSKSNNNTSIPTDIENWQLIVRNLHLAGRWDHCDTYSFSDLVSYKGSSYASLINDNSALPTDCEFWQLIAKEGDISSKGSWCECEKYDKGDVVSYEGSSYVSKKNCNSSLPTDDCNWDLLATAGRSVLFKGKWVGCGDYKKGDIVYYHGSSYVSLIDCNNDYPSCDSSWSLLAKEGSNQYEGAYDFVRHYAKGDIVSYNGSSYVSRSCDNTSLPTDGEEWGLLAKAGTSIVYKGEWNSDIPYNKDEIVKYQGTIYMSTSDDNRENPGAESWVKLVEGGTTIHYNGRYNFEYLYYENDVVTYYGSSYISLRNTNTSPPTDCDSWDIIAKAAEIKYKGCFDENLTYCLGDVVVYHGSSFVSKVNNNHCRPNVDCFNNSDWGLLAKEGSGLKFKGNWNFEDMYCAGDLVTYKGSSYICLTDCGCSDGDPACNTDKWAIFAARGVSMKFVGKWRQCHEYCYYDVVTHKSDIYLSISDHNDEDICDENYWIRMVNNDTWRGTWDHCKEYDSMDMVYYDGSTYISKCDNNTALPTDSCEWSVVALAGTGMNYIGDYLINEIYSTNQVVSYNGSSYVSKNDGNSALPTDSTAWGIVAQGTEDPMNWRGSFNSSIGDEYMKNDVVYSGSNVYIAQVDNAGDDVLDTSKWLKIALTDGMVWKGPYLVSELYHTNSVVAYNGGSYISKINDNTSLPTETILWDVLVKSSSSDVVWDMFANTGDTFNVTINNSLKFNDNVCGVMDGGIFSSGTSFLAPSPGIYMVNLSFVTNTTETNAFIQLYIGSESGQLNPVGTGPIETFLYKTRIPYVTNQINVMTTFSSSYMLPLGSTNKYFSFVYKGGSTPLPVVTPHITMFRVSDLGNTAPLEPVNNF